MNNNEILNESPDERQKIFNRWIRAAQRIIKPPANRSLSEWMDAEYVMSAESSASPGRWRTLPYQKEMLDAVTCGQYEKITIKKSARIGYTQLLCGTIAYYAANDPSNIMVAQPTDRDAEKFSKSFIAAMLRDVPALNNLFSRGNERQSTKSDTILTKTFSGGVLYLVGANSARGARMVNVRILLQDEIDGWAASAGKEGDFEKLTEMRTNAVWNRLIIKGSTPTIEGISRINKAYLQSSQGVCEIPCPVCGKYHHLSYENFKWPVGNPERAYFVCPHCAGIIEHRDKFPAIEKCKWKHLENWPDKKHIGFRIWSAYSYAPNTTWAHIAKEDEETAAAAKRIIVEGKVVNPRQAFVNTWLGRTYQEEIAHDDMSAVDYHQIKYPDGKIPLDVLFITTGVDVQGDRLELETVGWGTNDVSYGLEYIVFFGDTALTSSKVTAKDETNPWQKLYEYRQKKFVHETGVKIGISCMFIDSGFRERIVSTFVRENQSQYIFAVKGLSHSAAPLVQYGLRRRYSKIWRVNVGVFAGKELIYSRLRLESGQSGCMFYPDDGRYPQGYFGGLTSEQLRILPGGIRRFVHPPNAPANEPLDCRVYATAARYFAEPDFEGLKKKLSAYKNQAIADNLS